VDEQRVNAVIEIVDPSERRRPLVDAFRLEANSAI
jgi:hypothetical protein